MTRPFAFWPNDQFPFVLGGEAADLSFKNVGGQALVTALVPTYQGRYVACHVTEKVEEGRSVLNELEALQRAYREEQQQLLGRYMAKAVEFAPWLADQAAYKELSAD
ncbi:hypothetical protein K2O51_31160 (plasmid) [Cupriavidus pinatubonensis]|uniref:hypothetical protein n=1 Tax=Cupriavidus pinatubonensis TaxID=248026 RepID=UPI001C72DB96|nr:hypothetical protein [Cupriavidus pinatubonensis]QYY33706.1 hypothetical protein K2O51_31160 [Cupriavidus pinatubonensis]